VSRASDPSFATPFEASMSASSSTPAYRHIPARGVADADAGTLVCRVAGDGGGLGPRGQMLRVRSAEHRAEIRFRQLGDRLARLRPALPPPTLTASNTRTAARPQRVPPRRRRLNPGSCEAPPTAHKREVVELVTQALDGTDPTYKSAAFRSLRSRRTDPLLTERIQSVLACRR
jgi:hypothetical protein